MRHASVGASAARPMAVFILSVAPDAAAATGEPELRAIAVVFQRLANAINSAMLAQTLLDVDTLDTDDGLILVGDGTDSDHDTEATSATDSDATLPWDPHSLA